MKCINYDLNRQVEIANFLGIDESLIEKVLSELLSKGLIQRENILKLTELGSISLEKQTVLAPLSETKTFYIDALNGKLSSNFSLNSFDSKNNFVLNKIVKKPRKNNIEDVVDYYEYIEKSLQNYNNSNQIELIQVNDIESVYTDYHELSLVLYQRNTDDQEIEYEIFSRGSIQVDYRTTIEQLYAEGKKILDPIFQEIKQEIKDDKLIESNNENAISVSIAILNEL